MTGFFEDDLSTASEYLRMAVTLMIQRRIPPTPYNYALWYAHVQNRHPELSRALLEQFSDPESYSHEKSAALFFEFFSRNESPSRPGLRKAMDEDRGTARLDALTGIATRRAFDAVLDQSLCMTDEPTCLLMLDLDRLKVLGEPGVHAIDERVLVIVGDILASLQSETVFVARYDARSFAVILHDRLAVAQDLAATLRQQVLAIRLSLQDAAELTGAIPIGLVQAVAGDTPQTLVERAVMALRLDAV